MIDDMDKRLRALRVVPVLVVDDADAAEPLGRALVAGGLPCAEVTFRTPAAPEVLRRMARIPGLLAGAGTVTNPEQVKRAVDAGARFVVSPGFSAAVVAECRKAGIFALPGICTPTEIMAALAEDVKIVKFFPASAYGGVKTLKALSAPFGGVSFVPTGGIDAANLHEYLAVKSVLACGGSWMATAEHIKAKDWTGIETRTREAAALAAAN